MLAGNGQKAIEFLINVIDTYLQDAPNLLWEIDRSITRNTMETQELSSETSCVVFRKYLLRIRLEIFFLQNVKYLKFI
jgi:hypothetical protein